MRQYLSFYALVMVLLTVAGCSEKRPVDYVDPFIGTGFHGHTYPGATTPFGAVQLSPDTRRGNWDACSGYHYSDSTIIGFSHTHLSGTGCIDLGDILFHPMLGKIRKAKTGYIFDPLAFSHRNEQAKAGYYQVKLDNGILAELTTTAHVGVHRYTFPNEGNPKIVIDLAHLLDAEKIKEAELQVNDHEVAGMRCTRGWVDDQYIYFVAQFSQPGKTELISSGETVPYGNAKGENLQAVFSFPEMQEKSVVVKVGLSSVSIENARQNLQTEMPDFDFDRIKNEAQNQWNKALSAFHVSGGNTDEMTNFYTAVYHSIVVPNVISDVNGDYRGADMKIRNSGGRKVYSTFSLWDTFRAWNPMMTLVDSALVNNMINSFLDFYDQTGELPIWPLSSGETGTMIGYHSVSVIYDAFSKNIRGYNVEKAFEAMKVSANKNKKGVASFLESGFIPADSKRESVSRLLEGAYDDWCIAQMAKALGHQDDYNDFIRRAQLYKNVFDGSDRFFRPRLHDGIWVTPFDPTEAGRAYTEATAWQYRFFVPHDINGLIDQFGGVKYFGEALDSLFKASSETKNKLSDISGLVGQYAHGNEPSHHMAYLFSFAGQPWKTQELVRRLLNEMYHPTPEGIIGNEDCGQMSAWYVMSSIGLYPVCPGSTQYILTSPVFPKSVIHLANGKELQITANDPASNMYIQKVLLNNQPLGTDYITYDQLMRGGELKFVLGSEPNKEWGADPDALPYSFSKTKEVSIPYVSNDISFFKDEVAVDCGDATEGAEIHYTLDGSEPTENSASYTSPVTLKKSATIKLRAFKTGYEPSVISVYNASQAELIPSANINLKKNGVHYKYYEGEFSATSEVASKGEFIKSGDCDSLSLSMAEIPDYYGFIFSGFINVPVDGVYTFSTSSDDGSVLEINGRKVVDNDGSHGETRALGRIALKKGFHPYVIRYFESYEGQALSMSWILPGSQNEEKISPKYLFTK